MGIVTGLSPTHGDGGYTILLYTSFTTTVISKNPPSLQIWEDKNYVKSNPQVLPLCSNIGFFNRIDQFRKPLPRTNVLNESLVCFLSHKQPLSLLSEAMSSTIFENSSIKPPI
jgi:hypothetical protein